MSEEKVDHAARLREDGVYAFPEQVAISARGQNRYSHIFIRLVPAPGVLSGMNWNLADEVASPIVAGYIDGSVAVPASLVAVVWTETGVRDGKVMRSAPTYVRTGKNLGKKNATNVVQQAIVVGTTSWNKKGRKAGYAEGTDELATVQAGHVKPMALVHYPAQREGEPFDITTKRGSGDANVVYYTPDTQMYISPKLDGDRLVASVDPDGQVDLWGRAGETPPNVLELVRTQLALLLSDAAVAAQKPIVLDGELYLHGQNHQFTHGIYAKHGADASQLVYAIFDMIDENPFNVRLDALNALLNECDLLPIAARPLGQTPSSWPNLARVPQRLVRSVVEIEAEYTRYLAAGFEGAVLRKPAGLYQPGTRKEVRSRDVIKLKPDYDAEFKIVGYAEGKGNDAGAIIWELETTNKAGQRVTFTARPKGMSLEERRALFAEMRERFDRDFLGRQMTVFYGDTTADGIPRFPRAGAIRPES